MKKFLVLCFAFVLAMPFVSYAANVGSPETQGKGKIAAGVDADILFNRDLKFDSMSILGPEYSFKNSKLDKGYDVLFKVSYGVFDNTDVYVKLGVSDSKGKGDEYLNDTKLAGMKLDTDTGFAWGMGLKQKFELGNSWFLGYDLQYLRTDQKVSVTEDDGTTGTYDSYVAQEWHVAPYIAKRMDNFTPYLGVRYSDEKIEISKAPPTFIADNIKLEADNNFGVFLGTDYKIADNCSLNVEGRFIDETAVSAGLSWKF